MGRHFWTCLAAASAAVFFGTTARAGQPAVDPSATLFAERCATCHNIGGGPKVGPDLLGVSKRRDKAWFGRFVRGPSRAIDERDPIALELFQKFQPVRMPDQPLTDAELDGVWGYFDACTGKGGCEPVTVGGHWGTDASDEDVKFGRALFMGGKPLHQGGGPCFACHSVRGEGMMGGGTLASDLTFSYARLGEKGMTPLLASAPGPVMHAVYKDAPLDDGEQFALKAYLAQLARDGTVPRKEGDFLLLGLEGMGLVLGAFTLRARVSRKRDERKKAR